MRVFSEPYIITKRILELDYGQWKNVSQNPYIIPPKVWTHNSCGVPRPRKKIYIEPVMLYCETIEESEKVIKENGIQYIWFDDVPLPEGNTYHVLLNLDESLFRLDFKDPENDVRKLYEQYKGRYKYVLIAWKNFMKFGEDLFRKTRLVNKHGVCIGIYNREHFLSLIKSEELYIDPEIDSNYVLKWLGYDLERV